MNVQSTQAGRGSYKASFLERDEYTVSSPKRSLKASLVNEVRARTTFTMTPIFLSAASASDALPSAISTSTCGEDESTCEAERDDAFLHEPTPVMIYPVRCGDIGASGTGMNRVCELASTELVCCWEAVSLSAVSGSKYPIIRAHVRL